MPRSTRRPFLSNSFARAFGIEESNMLQRAVLMAQKLSDRLSTADVARYEATRYRGDQKLIDRREQAIIRELLALAAGGRRDLAALDLPCGFGRFSPALLEVASWLVDFDRSESMAMRSRDRAAELGARSPGFGVADIRALPIADRSFDVVLSMRLLHHLRDPADRKAMFAELARVTKGHLVTSFYDHAPLHRAQRAVTAVFKPKRRASKLMFLGTDVFEREAREAGLELLEVRAPLPIHAQRIALLKRVAR